LARAGADQFGWRETGPSAGNLFYDPTNGTVSGGEIMRFGGTPPGGAVYSYFWTNAVK